jgi:hypothetical protein
VLCVQPADADGYLATSLSMSISLPRTIPVNTDLGLGMGLAPDTLLPST